MNFTQLRREFSQKMEQVKQSLQDVFKAEKERDAAKFELEKRELLEACEKDKASHAAAQQAQFSAFKQQFLDNQEKLAVEFMDNQEKIVVNAKIEVANEWKAYVAQELAKQKTAMEAQHAQAVQGLKDVHAKQVSDLKEEISLKTSSVDFWKASAAEWKNAKLRDLKDRVLA